MTINIYSGEKGLGGALTNPTEISKHKGNVSKSYPIKLEGKHYPDVETAYKVLRTGHPAEDDHMMVVAIACKFRQHPELYEQVKARGGAEWLKTTSHIVSTDPASASSWEGHGEHSRFIRNLVKGYLLAESGEALYISQNSLF